VVAGSSGGELNIGDTPVSP